MTFTLREDKEMYWEENNDHYITSEPGTNFKMQGKSRGSCNWASVSTIVNWQISEIISDYLQDCSCSRFSPQLALSGQANKYRFYLINSTETCGLIIWICLVLLVQSSKASITSWCLDVECAFSQHLHLHYQPLSSQLSCEAFCPPYSHRNRISVRISDVEMLKWCQIIMLCHKIRYLLDPPQLLRWDFFDLLSNPDIIHQLESFNPRNNEAFFS